MMQGGLHGKTYLNAIIVTIVIINATMERTVAAIKKAVRAFTSVKVHSKVYDKWKQGYDLI